VRQKDVLEVDEADVGPQELPLCALTAVDQESVAASTNERGRGGPLGCGSRTRRPEEHDVQIHYSSLFQTARGCLPCSFGRHPLTALPGDTPSPAYRGNTRSV